MLQSPGERVVDVCRALWCETKIDKSADEQFIKFPLTALSAELREGLCLYSLCGAQLFLAGRIKLKTRSVWGELIIRCRKLLLIGKMCLGSEKRRK